jgi:hypothetical protein
MNRHAMLLSASLLTLVLALVLLAQDKTAPGVPSVASTKFVSLASREALEIKDKKGTKYLSLDSQGYSEARVMIQLNVPTNRDNPWFGKTAKCTLNIMSQFDAGNTYTTSKEELVVAGKSGVFHTFDVKIRSDHTKIYVVVDEVEAAAITVSAVAYLVR